MIRQRKGNTLYKAILALRWKQNFQVNWLEYLKEAMTLYGTYSAISIEEIVDAINH